MRAIARMLVLAAVALAVGTVEAQTSSVPRLSDYVGTYTDTPGHPVEIVNGVDFFAVQDGAKYNLMPRGVDAFSTQYGPKFTFKRDAVGKVTGYEQNGTFHPQTSSSVTKEAEALARPRPMGQDTPADYHYRPPPDMHDGIQVGDIARSDLGAGTAAAVVDAILDGSYKDVHGILLYQGGKLVLEEYFYGYTAEKTHQLRSATKSIVSILAGIAIDQKALSGTDETVLTMMPYTAYAHPDPRKAGITLGDFLSMSSGLDCNDHTSTSPGRETVIDDTLDWVKATLDLPMIGDPGTHGYYCSGGVAVVGRMTENAVHTTLPEYAQAKLFTPLGIRRKDWAWNYDLTNADKEYSQIHLRPRDMLKLGILFAQNGRWLGQQVVSPAWVRASTSEQSHVENVSYGYFWWRPWLNAETPTGPQRVDVVAAQGNGGQKIYLVPQYDLVAVFTGGAYNADGTPPNAIMAKIILPALIKTRAIRIAKSNPK